MPEPRLSLVIAGSRSEGPPPGLFSVLRPYLESGDLEVLVATTSDLNYTAPGVILCRRPEGTVVPRLRGAGVRKARAPWVVVSEDFCLPSRGWAEAMLGACESVDAVAVGGPVDRQQGDAPAWALTLAEYGRFLPGPAAGPVPDLPEINVAYRLQRLRNLLGELPEEWMLSSLHSGLRQLGEPLWWEPSALMFDVGRPALGSAVRAQFHHGRLFGGEYVAKRGAAFRSMRLMAASVAPAVQFSRLLGPCLRARRTATLLKALPPLIVLLGAWALGEALGCVAGPGDSKQRWL